MLPLLAEAFTIQETKTLDELVDKIVSAPVPCICILENIHHLYLRTVNGFDSVERLMLFMQKTRGSVFWIVSCALFGWQYLDKVMSISTFFQKDIMLGTQSREQMSSIILKRHRMSGYRIKYEIPSEVTKTRKFKRLHDDRDRQAFMETLVFRQLAEMSAGNIRVAMLFWLTTIKAIDSENIVVTPKIGFDHTFLYQLPEEELFTLAALIQHEILNAHDHTLVFRQDNIDSMLILNKMLSRGLVQLQPSGFYVHPFLYRPVVEVLRSKKMLQ